MKTRITSLLFSIMLFGCLTDNDSSKKDEIQPGNYQASIYNTFTELMFTEGGIPFDMEVNLNGTLNLNLIEGGACKSTTNITMTFSTDGVPPVIEILAISTTGTWSWRQSVSQLCTDDGTGQECDQVRDVSKNSFSMANTDPENIKMFGTSWITFIKI